MTQSKKSIEETYKKLSQREHILLRGNMYIGSTKKQLEELWVAVDQEDSYRMEKKMVEYTPGFIKIFDEILTNATDHATRDPTVTTIKVEFDRESGMISVWNNGKGIPVVMHQEHNMYVPELIFGHFLSGSNYNDTDVRTGAGTNGVGSKCTSVYSKRFIIETIDSDNQKKFVQEFTDNMEKRTKPKVTSNSGKSYTKITFYPDYARFGMTSLEEDAILIMQKRVLDCIACTSDHVQVYLNGKKLKGKGLLDYTKYFLNSHEIISDSFISKQFVWEWAIVPSESFEQISFVNGNSTTQGGKHVDFLLNQIVTKLKHLLETKKKLKDIKPALIKERLFLFLRATVANPSFNSQTKEFLITPVKDFGFNRFEVTDKFIDKLYKSSIVEEIIQTYKLKESLELAKSTNGKKVSRVFIPKLEDALWAGTAKSDQCTLVLTEGDSAKTFAMWGRSIVGNERFGVMPLRGKCCSEDTLIPLWNGEIKYAKNIKIGDELIGDDGNKRKVLTLFNGYGKMYEISQDKGDSYKVNDEHILTLCIPEHKKIFWVPSNYSWKTIYWDKETKNIKAKESLASIKIQCKECNIMISTKCIRKHYMRKHKNVKYIPYKLEDKDMNNSYVIEARKKLEEFLLTIDDNNIIDICIQDYFNISDAFKRKVKGIRGECINWEYKNVQLDPYVLGLWLGDGCKNGYQYACNGNYDVEIMNYLEKWGETNDCQFKKVQSTKYSYSISSIDNFRKKGESPLKKLLSTYNLVNNKHIPKEYLINSKEVRLKLLAGIIDTDGYVAKDGTIEISQTHKHKRLIDDIVYLSRSLGFYTYVSYKKTNYTYKQTGEKADAYRIKISGDTSEIPTLLPRKKSRSTTQYNMRNSTGIIKIKPIADSNYIGIGIDGNNRFLINDFTVTHNCLNIRDATVSQLMNNEELNNLKQIIGLKTGKEYTNTSDLRYGKVMVLTDADLDGNHITSLIVNMFHAQFPSLIKLDFLQTLRTPIVKATRNGQTVEFFTEQDYHTWKDSVGDSISRYNIKYFKGLGTSKKEDAQAIFRRFDELKADFYYRDHRCDEAILLAFDKDKNVSKSDANATIKCSDKRKAWLSNYDRNDYLDIKQTKIPYADLINKGLIHFSIYDNVRSIPHLIDGLKPSQRKILWYMLEKNITRDIKVAQLSGYVSAETSYHHGETSLQGAIIGMAQDFVGSNNLPLLTPEGNFGSRFGLGKDAASPRYIFTRLQPWTTTIYDQRDAPLLNYLNDDGQSIEPDYFIPIIPMALVNGCEGIGTGFSTYIPPHNPKDIINNLLLVLDDKDPIPMKPYFRGFNGVLTTGDAHDSDRVGSWVTKGIWKKISSTQIEITELPIGVGITGYKEFLESMIEGCNASNKKKGDSKEKEKTIKFPFKDVKNNTKDENSSISFIVDFKSSFDLEKLINSGTLEKELKLTRSFTTTNMYLFDESLIPTKYLNTTDILLDFYDIRLDMYSRRRTYLIKQLEKELIVLETKVRFISEYISGVLDINRKTKAVIFELLKSRGYPDHPDEHSYEFLIRMQIASLTKEKIEELENTTANKRESLIELQNKSEKDLWKEDLNNLKCHLGQ